MSKESIQLYGLFGIGATYRNELRTYDQSYYSTYYINGVNTLGNSMETIYNLYHLNFQITPFGFAIGNRMKWFVEFGFGYKGVLSSGYSFKL